MLNILSLKLCFKKNLNKWAISQGNINIILSFVQKIFLLNLFFILEMI